MENKIFEITNFLGEKLKLKPRVELYTVQDFMGVELPGLAIALDDVTTGENEGQFDVLTVSFGEFIGAKNCAYIDTNNCSFADQLFAQGIAKDTGFTKHSGFCVYPLWCFDEEFLKEIGGENYKTYSEAFDAYMASMYGQEPEESEEPEA